MAVTLRTKPISGGKLRLYFDFYPAIANPLTGEHTRREVLSLFLYADCQYEEVPHTSKGGHKVKKILPVLDKGGEPKKIRLTPLQRQHNKETEELAENIRAQRVLQLQAEDYGFLTHDNNASFLDFIKGIAEKRREAGDNNPYCVYNHLRKFTNDNCPVSMLSPDFCADFRDFLVNTITFEDGKQAKLSANTAQVYFTVFKTLLKKAQDAKLITSFPAAGVDGVKKKDSIQRQYLTYEELTRAAATDCDLPLYKRACLFSALTGLRFSDMHKLTWAEIEQEQEGYLIRFITKKTGRAQTLPISNDAYALLGKNSDDPTAKAFPGLKYGAWQNNVINRWIRNAGINKHITFHCFRHSYATIQLTLGTDIYTVSKMLGHSDIKTTQIYAKIVDQTKRTAANRISLSITQ